MKLGAMEAVDTEIFVDATVHHIVSDKFSTFANGANILSYRSALEQLELITSNTSCIVLGQGLNPSEIDTLKQKIEHLCGSRAVPVLEQHSERAPKELVHKQDLKNVLITRPRHIRDLIFQANLVIDDDCAEMSDHQSGEHIQGALLSESARQLFMACALSFNVAPSFTDKVEHIQFTLDELEVHYYNFVFPVETRLEIEFQDVQVNGSSASSRACIKFFQFDQLCCEVFFKAHAYSKKFLSCLEKRCTRKAQKQLESCVIAAPQH